MSNRAWVTLATNDSYGLGALVLVHSLRRARSAYPAVVLITPSVTEAMRNRLRAVFAEVVIVDVLDSKDAAHLALLQRPELGITFTKIHCWNLTQYEKCVFLDADTLIVQNCDELFEREEFSAAPDVGWPDCFNSGVFVFKPSAETFASLIKFAQERGSFDGGDQGLLNSYFSDWAHGDINKHLPFLYNVTSAAFYSYLPALKHYGQNLKVIHFIGATKPWLQQFNWETRTSEAPQHLRDFLQLWWDIFVGHVHCVLEESMTGVAGNLARVVLGAGAQREALDDLTRRQGWEAGNIDYMGADAFDNIWAKISQTLSQPRSPSPKQSTPPPQPPAPAAPVEEVPRALDTSDVNIPEEVHVAAPAPVPEIAADLTLVAPVETPKLPESPALPEAPAEIRPPTPINVPEPAVKAPSPAAVPVAAPEPAKVVAAAAPTKEPKPAAPAEVPAAEIPVATPPAEPEKPSTIPSKSPEPAKKIEDAVSAVPPKVVSSPAKAPAAPSKPEVTPEKAEERRKPAGKLQLHPPAAADPLPTPDSELEDAATLAHAIIASELRSPTVTSPSPPADPASPRPPLQEQRLSVEEPELPTPPVGAVSLSQIGVKPQPKGKSTTAAQIESSVTEAAADAPRKKVVKKVLKKEGAAGGEAPVPPPRKKEKKPKDK